MSFKQFFLVFSLFLFQHAVVAQEVVSPIDSVILTDSITATSFAATDTGKVSFFKKILNKGYPNPERAAAMSFVIPGSGQIYNKKAWWIKVPVIYGGYTALLLSGEFNRTQKNRFQTAYLAALNNEPHEFGNASPDRLRIQRDAFSKNFQLSYIGLVVFHFVQTLEAYTTGHLLEFDMDESLTVAPAILRPAGMGFGESRVGVQLSVRLGK